MRFGCFWDCTWLLSLLDEKPVVRPAGLRHGRTEQRCQHQREVFSDSLGPCLPRCRQIVWCGTRSGWRLGINSAREVLCLGQAERQGSWGGAGTAVWCGGVRHSRRSWPDGVWRWQKIMERWVGTVGH